MTVGDSISTPARRKRPKAPAKKKAAPSPQDPKLRAPEETAKRPKEPDPYLRRVLRMEIITAVDRRAPQTASKANPDGIQLQPFGKEAAWCPRVKKTRDDGKVVEEKAKSHFLVWKLCMQAIQRRLAHVANQFIAELWVQKRLEKGAPGTRPKSWEYPYLCDSLHESFFGSVRKHKKYERMKDFSLKRFSGPFVSTMQHKLALLFRTVQKNTFGQTIPVVDRSWPLYIRPDTWRMKQVSGGRYNIVVNIDGTKWELGLAIPRGKRRAKKSARDKFVMITLARIFAGERLRGVPTTSKTQKDLPRPTRTEWGPGILGIQEKKGKWYALIEYRQPIRPPMEVPNHIAVHCGLRNFAVALTLDDVINRKAGIWARGDDLEAAHRRLNGRRRAILKSKRKYRRGGRGHAESRVRELNVKEHQWVQTFCHRISRRIVRHAVRTKSEILFMDLTDIRRRAELSDLPNHVATRVHRAPWFTMRMMIQHAAEAAGIPVRYYTPWYHTKRCPMCLTTSDAAVDYRRWRFTCPECDFQGDVDRVAVCNVFVDLREGAHIEFPDEGEHRRLNQGARDAALLAGLDKAPKIKLVEKSQDVPSEES